MDWFNTKYKPSKITSNDPKVSGGWIHVDDTTYLKEFTVKLMSPQALTGGELYEYMQSHQNHLQMQRVVILLAYCLPMVEYRFPNHR